MQTPDVEIVVRGNCHVRVVRVEDASTATRGEDITAKWRKYIDRFNGRTRRIRRPEGDTSS